MNIEETKFTENVLQSVDVNPEHNYGCVFYHNSYGEVECLAYYELPDDEGNFLFHDSICVEWEVESWMDIKGINEYCDTDFREGEVIAETDRAMHLTDAICSYHGPQVTEVIYNSEELTELLIRRGIVKPVQDEPKRKYVEYTLPTYAVYAIIYGDYTGLSDSEEKQIKDFLMGEREKFNTKALYVCGPTEEAYFAHHNDLNGLGGNVYDVKVYIH